MIGGCWLVIAVPSGGEYVRPEYGDVLDFASYPRRKHTLMCAWSACFDP